ncbi:CD2-associated protein [Mytilus galloprovincialis]|uniref:CD2-associated protein n=1 Tax=Mytilus galloprovincialis TaxID=29158 RepID=A0A8B6DV30_MYTGA|nr:CD2-associated protein [Mytilus galloprovincialis]
MAEFTKPFPTDLQSGTMTSMSSLKSKLHKLKKEDTSEVTDYKTWMRKITDCGNRAEDWLEYTTYMRHNLNFNDRFQAHNFLSDLYEKAFRAIDGKANKDNEAFAHLFIDFAEVKSEQLLLEDAIQLLTEARNIVKRYAIVHIASAELEVKEGNISKARNILNKARLFKFEPTELLVEALKKLDAGETILLSPRHRRYSSSQSKVNLSDDSQSIFHGGAPEGNLQEHIGPDEMETAPVMMESHKEKYVTVRANSCRPAMRSYSSTPEMRSLTNLQWKRKDIGVPQRVRKLNLPFTTTAEEEEDEEGVEDMDTMAGFTPLEPQASSTFVSMTTAQSSGYQSMMETTIPLETGNQFENNLFHSGKQEFDLSGIHPQKQAFDLSEIHPQKQAFNLSGIHPQKQILDMSGIHPQRQTCDLSGILSQRQTCDLSSKQSKSLKEPTKSDNVSLLQPNGRPQIMKSQVLPDTKSNLVSFNQVSANPIPSRGASRVVTPNQMSDFPTLSKGGPIVVSPNQVSGNPTPNGGAPRVVTPNQVSANPTPNRGAPKVVTPNQVSANLHPNRRVPELPTPNRSIEPTPSKHVMSDRLSNVPICATPSAVQQTSIPCTPSVMQDVETITVNNVVYMILDLLGKGGSSKVYHVHDSKPPSKALKVVNLNDANEEIVNGYKNEVKLLLQLQYCPKVIKLYDYEYRPEENKLYIVMEYGNCDFAQFLKDKIKEDCKLSDHLIKYYWESMLMAVHALHKEGRGQGSWSDHLIKYNWESMLMAVHALHKEGIIHSDLKPSNFIIIGGALKLIDFGIAKSVQPDKTSVLTEMQVGTLNYMSPESIADYGLDEKPMYKKCLIRDPKVRPSIEDLLHHPYLKREKKEGRRNTRVIGRMRMCLVISCLFLPLSLSFKDSIVNLVQVKKDEGYRWNENVSVECIVEFDYEAEQPDELSIKVGQILKNVLTEDGGWWEGELDGKKGMFPDNFVKIIEKKDKPVEKREKHEDPKRDIKTQQRTSVRDLASKIKDGIPVGASQRKKESHQAVIKRAKVLYSYEPDNEDELKLDIDDVVEVFKQEEEGWWEGSLHGKVGVFPSNFVQVIEEIEPTAKQDHIPEEKPKEPPQAEPKTKKIVGGVGLGNIFDGGPIKLRSATRSKVPPPEQETKPEEPSHHPASVPKKDKQEKAIVRHSYDADNEDELALKIGEVVNIISKEEEDPGWWKGELNGKIGVFPDNFVELMHTDEFGTDKVLRPKFLPKSEPQPRPKKPPPPTTTPSLAQASVKLPEKTAAPEAPHHTDKHVKKEKEDLPSVEKSAPPALPSKKPSVPPPLLRKPAKPDPPRPTSQTEHKLPPPTITKEEPTKDTEEKKHTGQFDEIQASSDKLTHLTASRPKGPSKRPPSQVFNHTSQGITKTVKVYSSCYLLLILDYSIQT